MYAHLTQGAPLPPSQVVDTDAARRHVAGAGDHGGERPGVVGGSCRWRPHHMGRHDAEHSRLSGIAAAPGSVDVATPQLGLMSRHSQRPFGPLVSFVEQRTPLSPDQCIGRGGVNLDAPAAASECAQLFVR